MPGVRCRARNVSSASSQLVIALLAFIANSCLAASLPTDALSSNMAVGEILITHVVFLAPRVDLLHSVPGLSTAVHALRALFTLSTSGTPPGRWVSLGPWHFCFPILLAAYVGVQQSQQTMVP